MSKNILLCFILFPLISLVNSDSDYETFNNESNHTDESCIEGLPCESNGAQQFGLIGGTSTSSLNSISEKEKEFWDIEGLEGTNPINPLCSNEVTCSSLPADCITCNFNYTCVYGKPLNVTCQAIHKCQGPREFQKSMTCRYCYQTQPEEHFCNPMAFCNSPANPVQKYRANCSTNDDVICLGNRKFFKNVRCNWTNGYKWLQTLILSITLGGFGVDRFYLGQWEAGIGKLFSFGGAGVWTILDVILIAIGYIKPADGSLYI